MKIESFAAAERCLWLSWYYFRFSMLPRAALVVCAGYILLRALVLLLYTYIN